MLSERQRNIIVELTLAGLTAQYISDRFNCSISTIQRIRKRYGETGRCQILPCSGRPKKTTALNERYLRRLVKRIRFSPKAQLPQELLTHIGHPVSIWTVQRMLHSHAIYSHVTVQKLDSTKQLVLLIFIRWIKVPPCILWGDGWVWKTAREKRIPKCILSENLLDSVENIIYSFVVN